MSRCRMRHAQVPQVPTSLGTPKLVPIVMPWILLDFRNLAVGKAIALIGEVRVIMELLMLIGFAGAVVLLGFLSCLAGGSSERKHIRGGRSEMPAPKWPARR
jgi:hypothetical protein